jgi:hypothetical protein
MTWKTDIYKSNKSGLECLLEQHMHQSDQELWFSLDSISVQHCQGAYVDLLVGVSVNKST